VVGRAVAGDKLSRNRAVTLAAHVRQGACETDEAAKISGHAESFLDVGVGRKPDVERQGNDQEMQRSVSQLRICSLKGKLKGFVGNGYSKE
jgi:hypothetical protein